MAGIKILSLRPARRGLKKSASDNGFLSMRRKLRYWRRKAELDKDSLLAAFLKYNVSGLRKK